MRRRGFLASVGAGSVPLTGCLGAHMPQDGLVRAVRDDPGLDVAVVTYADLPEAEQRITRTAVEENLYHACPDLPDALRTLADRFTYSAASYLAYEQSLYALYIQIEDTVRVNTAPPPDRTPSCGGF